jgi:hypothetical protein
MTGNLFLNLEKLSPILALGTATNPVSNGELPTPNTNLYTI